MMYDRDDEDPKKDNSDDSSWNPFTGSTANQPEEIYPVDEGTTHETENLTHEQPVAESSSASLDEENTLDVSEDVPLENEPRDAPQDEGDSILTDPPHDNTQKVESEKEEAEQPSSQPPVEEQVVEQQTEPEEAEVSAEEQERERVEQAAWEAAENFENEEFVQERRKFEEQAEEQRRRQGERNWIEFGSVSLETLNKVDKTFVKTDEFGNFFQQVTNDPRSEQNIFIVSGSRKSGRYALALRLAIHLSGEPSPTNIREHVPDITTRSLTLPELISRISQQIESNNRDSIAADDTSLPKHAIIIVRDLFEDARDNKIPELSQHYILQFKRMLGSVRIILTTSASPDVYPDMANYLYVRTEDKQGKLLVDMREIFKQHVDYYFPKNIDYYKDIRVLLSRMQDELLQKLGRPFDIDKYLERISVNEPTTDAEAKKIADEMMGARAQLSNIRKWFESFDFFNQKLYVMFAVLFHGLKRSQLDDLYDEAVTYLRADAQNKYDDPRYISVRTMLESIHMEEQESETLVFQQNGDAYIKVVQDQLRDYYRLLWSLVDLFVKKIHQSNASRDRRLRRLLATVIGQIGVYRKQHLQNILTAMVDTPDAPHVAESATYTLIEIASSVEHHEFIVKILRDWVNSHKFNRMVSAVGVLAGVYQKISEAFPNIVNRTPVDAESNQAPSRTLDESRIAEQTLNDLRKLLELFCDAVKNVDISDFDQFLRESRKSMYDKNLDNTLRQEPTLVNLWEHNPKFRHKLQDEVEKLVREQQKQMRTLVLVDLIDELRLTTIHRITDMAHSLPEQIVIILQQWLREDPESTRWQIARMTVNYLFKSNFVVDTRHLVLAQLLPDILTASQDITSNITELLLSHVYSGDLQQAGVGQARQAITELVAETPIRQVMLGLDKWYEYLLESGQAGAESQFNNEWQNIIYPLLLNTVNTARQTTRSIFADALIGTWLDSDHAEVRRSAVTLLIRAYVLNGIVLDIPVSRYGVMLIDVGDTKHETYESYLQTAYELSHRLTTLTPLHIFHMGWVADEPLVLGQFKATDPETGTIQYSKLKLEVASRPLLLMPILDPHHEKAECINPEECHFILVLNRNSVLDIADILDDAEALYSALNSTSNEYNPFLDVGSASEDIADTDEPEPAATDTFNPFQTTPDVTLLDDSPVSNQDDTKIAQPLPEQNVLWEWHGKFFVNNFGRDNLRDLKLPDGVINIYRTEPDKFDTIQSELEFRLQQQIMMNMHRLDADSWLSNVVSYLESNQQDGIEFNSIATLLASHDRPTLQAYLDTLVEKLDSVPETIPSRDVALAISWLILFISREDLELCVDIICDWLRSDDSAHKIIGKACTKQLFNFYGAGNYTATVAQHASLLNLLPPFIEQATHHTEFYRIIRILFQWAQNHQWSERLITHPEGDAPELLTALSFVTDEDDVNWIISEIEYIEALIRVQDLFLQLSQANHIRSFREFITLLNDLLIWVDQELKRQQAISEQQAVFNRNQNRRRRRLQQQYYVSAPATQKPNPLPKNISEDMARQLLELPGLNEQNQRRILDDLFAQHHRLLYDQQFRKNHSHIARNLKVVLDNMRLQLYSKDSQLPDLPNNKMYGLILVDVSGRYESLRTQVPTVAIDFLNELIKHEQGDGIVPVVHRMGRQDVIYTHQVSQRRTLKKVKLKTEAIWPNNLKQRFAPLIGPILTRYPEEQVAFVILIAAAPIYDIHDWSDLTKWQPRLFLYKMGASVPDSGVEHIPPEQGMEQTVKRIMGKTYRRK